jgi:hypothetical protein
MIRKFIATVRRLLAGPQLNQLASLDQDRMNSLFLLLSEDPLVESLRPGLSVNSLASKNKVSNEGSSAELELLKKSFAELVERVAVLERINYKSSSK